MAYRLLFYLSCRNWFHELCIELYPHGSLCILPELALHLIICTTRLQLGAIVNNGLI